MHLKCFNYVERLLSAVLYNNYYKKSFGLKGWRKTDESY